jgi:hypothetical protein
MGTAYQPKIVTDELVFMYDTGSGKSYKGEPTTNTAVTTGMAAYWNNSGTAAWSSNDTNVPRIFTNLPVFSMEKLTDGNSHIGIGSTSATVSTEYTYSVYVWIPSSNSVNMAGSSPYFRPQPANVSVGNLTYEGSAAWGTWPRDQWVRVSRTATTQATNVTSAYISCYLNTAGDKIYFTAPQFEQKGHLTPFVDGTRSATAGLLDLTKNATIDLTNMSFDSNAQMVFDGTDDRIYTSEDISFGNNTTWEAWVNRTSSVNSINMFMGRFLPYFGLRNNDILFSNSINSTQRNVYSTGFTPSNGTWYHLTFTTEYDGTNTTSKIYINGVLNNSGSFTGSQTQHSQGFAIGDGRDSGNWYPFNGKVSNVKIYDKTLTAAEVLQNFNATKDRFIR